MQQQVKHPAVIMKGSPTGEPIFVVTDYNGNVMMTSRTFETEQECKDNAKGLVNMMKTASHNRVNQLPSKIAHQ